MRQPEETKAPTCTYNKHASEKSNLLRIKPLQNPAPFSAQHIRPRTGPENAFNHENSQTPARHLSTFNPSFDSGDPSAPLTRAARTGGAGQSFEMGATSRSRSQGRMSESDW